MKTSKKQRRSFAYSIARLVIGIILLCLLIGVAKIAWEFVDRDAFEPDSVQMDTSDYVAEAQKMQITLESKKSEYYDCVKTSDSMYILNYMSELYKLPQFPFEKYKPIVLSKAIEDIASEKCAQIINDYESLYKQYVETDEAIFNQTHTVKKTVSKYEMRLFTLKGEAREKGKFIITNTEILEKLSSN
ncbi:MAG: hypothetical protein AAB914_02465 [Patescibacteria group bacterium]